MSSSAHYTRVNDPSSHPVQYVAGGYRDYDDDELPGGTIAGSHELDDFYGPGSVPAAYRLSGASFPSLSGSPPVNSYLPRSSSLASVPPAAVTPPRIGSPGPTAMSAPYSSLDTSSQLAAKEGYFDPQGRSGLRYQQRAEAAAAERGMPAGGGFSSSGEYRSSPSKRGRSKWLWATIIGGIVVIGVIVGVAVGVTQSNKSNTSNSSTLASSGTSNSSTITTSDDPSNFTKDSRLHNSMYGIAYTPNLVQLPWCGATQANVTRDIQLLSQLTTRLRLYGANCNQTALVLQAIQDTKVDLGVYIAIYVDSNTTAYNNQVDAITDALQTYGTDHVLGVTVGNEYILDAITPSTDLTTTAALKAISTITDDVASVNKTVQALGLSKNLPIGTSDAGSMFSTTLAKKIDYFQANVHPWFATVGVDDAAGWTWEFFQEFDVDVASEVSNNPDTQIAETGWPTQSMTSDDSNNGADSPGGDATVENLQTFLDTYICAANTNGTEYFFFEAFDEPWKEEFGGVEPYWGLFDSDRNLKNLTIPDCSHN